MAAGIALTMAMAPVMSAAASTNDGLAFGVGATSAVPAQGMGTTNTPPTVMTPVPANGRVSCYGYYGTFRAGTEVMVVHWATAKSECFGIATDRTIWHAWSGSGGWTPMPGNGHADYILRHGAIEDSEQRTVAVQIPTAPRPYWCQNYVTSRRVWTGWYSC
ncbi:hypothetical protein GCM10027184_17060 [Saccharothrix stipae]